MFVLGIWVCLLVALLTVKVSVVAAAIHRDELIDSNIESLSFIRLTLTGIFGVVLVQTLNPLNLSWWITALISLGAMFVLLLGSQVAARILGARKFGAWMAKRSSKVVQSLDLLFTPLSVSKQETPDEFEQELLDSVDEFGETIVREVMVPRIDMATVHEHETLGEALQIFIESGYSRLPVLGKNIDDVVGIIYLKDVTRAFAEDGKKFAKKKAGELARKPLFVPDSKPVDDLLREFQVKSTHIAVVIDEYGGVAGLVTLEDLIEEIVGDISDEYDSHVSEVQELADGSYRVSARYSLFDLGEMLELDLVDDDVDSVGGLLAKLLGRLPLKGDSVSHSGVEFVAERLEGRRKRLVSVLVKPAKELTDARAAFGKEPE